MKKQLLLSGVIGTMLVLSTGCGMLNSVSLVSGDIEKYNVNVEKDKADELEIELNLGAGEMNVIGGSNEWVTGEIEYNNDKLKPNVSYDLNGNKGEVVIEQDKNINFNVGVGDIKNGWDLELTNEIPIDLHVKSGASDTKLELSGIELHELNVDAGVGDIKIDLSGDWQESFNANIHTGVGETTVILPKEVGVKLTSKNGIGKSNFKGLISQGDNVYVNDAYESADVLITLEVDTGVGEVTFELEK